MSNQTTLPCAVEAQELKKAKEILAAARHTILESGEPIAQVLLQCSFVPTTTIPTMATTKKAVVLWNPNFVLGRKKLAQVVTVIKHELWHLALNHAARGEAIMAINSRITHAELNVAGDRCINPGLLRAGGSFGEDLDDKIMLPKQIGAPDGLTMDEYILIARQKQEEQKQQQKQQEQDEQDEQDDDSSGDDEQDGDGADEQDGEQDDEQDDSNSGEQDGSGSADGDGDGDEDAGESGGKEDEGFGHGSCGSAAGAPVEAESMLDPELGKDDETMDDTRQQVAEKVMEQARMGRGNYSSEVLRWAEKLTAKPKVRWQQVLPRLVKRALTTTTGAGAQSYLQVSRRQAGIGYGVGKPVMAGNRMPVPQVQVWADTSGSMGNAQLSSMLTEIEALLKATPGKVTFGVCDAKVHAFQQVAKVSEIIPLLKGGGGTDFRPLFAQAEKARPKADVVVVLTDGAATLPPVAPKGVKVVWVLVGPYRVKTMPWGDVIDVPDEVK